MNALVRFLLSQSCRNFKNVSMGGPHIIFLSLIKRSYYGWLSRMTSSEGPFQLCLGPPNPKSTTECHSRFYKECRTGSSRRKNRNTSRFSAISISSFGFTPRLEQGRRCNYAAWSLFNHWAAFLWVLPARPASPIVPGAFCWSCGRTIVTEISLLGGEMSWYSRL